MMNKFRSHGGSKAQAGFTIAEVTIASGVFAVVLMVIVLATIGFFAVYYRSLAKSSVQNTAEAVSNTIEQSVRLSLVLPSITPPASGNPGYFCAGGQEFSFFLGKAEGTSELTAGQHALYEAAPTGGCISVPTQSNGVSLLSDHYRLLNFKFQPLSGNAGFAIDIKIANTTGGTNGAGDDLLCSPTTNGCSPTSTQLTPAQLSSGTISDITCRYGSGSQFCAVAELQSIIGIHVF